MRELDELKKKYSDKPLSSLEMAAIHYAAKLTVAELAALRAENERMRELIKTVMEAIGTCNTCDGSGIDKINPSDACRECGGTGRMITSHGLILSDFYPDARAALAETEEK